MLPAMTNTPSVPQFCRRALATATLLSICFATVGTAQTPQTAASTIMRAAPVPRPYEVTEASVTDLQQALTAGRVTSVQLVNSYLARIAAYDQAGPSLNAMLRTNPRARAEAAAGTDVARPTCLTEPASRPAARQRCPSPEAPQSDRAGHAAAPGARTRERAQKSTAGDNPCLTAVPGRVLPGVAFSVADGPSPTRDAEKAVVGWKGSRRR